MTSRIARGLTWSLPVIYLAILAFQWTLLRWNGTTMGLDGSTSFIGVFGMLIVGVLIVTRYPRNAVGWVFCAIPIAMALQTTSTEYAIYGYVMDKGAVPYPLHVFSLLGGLWVSLGLLSFVFLLFPTGSLPSPRWRFVMWIAAVNQILLTLVMPFTDPTHGGDGFLAGANNPLYVPGTVGDLVGGAGELAFMMLMPLFGLSALSLVFRYREADQEQRHQLKWVLFAVVFVAAASVLDEAVFENIGTLGNIADTAFNVGIATLIPLSVGVAMFKYRLYDIDVVISKTVVFAGLAAFITAIYVGIVVGVGTLMGAGGEPNLALSIVATALVAVAFQPVRERLTRLTNRLVFGKRATPYEVLSTFSSHLAEVAAPEQTLERMAQLLVDGTGAARAQIWLDVAGQLRPAVTWPTHMTDDTDPGHLVDVTHEGEKLGALSIDKQRGETLTPTDIKLVDDLAAQAGLVLRNLRLTDDLKAKIVDLQASRQRLVAAQDAERRRLERDLHDGAQRQLVALKDRLAAAVVIADSEEAERAAQLLGQLTGDADDAVETLRELAHGIFPPLLAAEGLAGALTAQAAKAAVPAVVEAEGVGRYSQDVEAAVYFCVLEAIQNAAKYADPSQVTVRLSEHAGQLTFTVTDDGTGFDPTTTAKGAGTTNMTDRLDALDGDLDITSQPGQGTTITGALPAETIGADG